MRRLWLFNPDNDLALAANLTSYTPPVAAARLRRSGQSLPLWMGLPGDFVLCDGLNAEWLDGLHRDFGIEVQPWDHLSPAIPTPWGWSRAARTTFLQAGVPVAALPPDGALDAWRELSGRRTAAILHERLARTLPFEIWPGAEVVSDNARLRKALDNGPTVVKLPWSSSGRGVFFCNPTAPERVLRQAQDAIAKYGYVTVEPMVVDRVSDFAMLFISDGQAVRFQGLSLFQTDERGNYRGNVVAPQRALAAMLGAVCPTERMRTVASALERELTGLLGGRYAGPVGVDMLVTADGLLHATVEVNLRFTMGFLALSLERFAAQECLLEVASGDQTPQCRPEIADGRLHGGSLALTPPGGDFTFILRVR